MKKNIQKQIALSLLLILLMLLAVSAVSSFALSGAVDAPVVIDPKNNISILMEAKEGTTEGTRELKESGTIVSVKEENTFTVTAFSKNYNTKLHMIYTVNGEDVPVDGDKFEYVCRSEEDYKPLTVRVYDEKNEQLGEFTFQLEYKEVGFFRNLFLTVTGNKTIQEIWRVTKEEMPFAIFETFYVTILSTVFSLILGLPLGVLLVVGDKKGILPFPRWLMSFLNVLINLLRSIPFLILMIMVIPLSRLIVGTSVGTVATIIPLVFAAFPFVARLVETSLREVNPNIIEAAQSMGASPFQIIVKVMIPESVPSLVSNVTIAVTTILGYSAMSGVIGGGGLGQIAINYGYYRYQYATMVVAVILLIVLVQIFQSIGTALAKKLDKRLK